MITPIRTANIFNKVQEKLDLRKCAWSGDDLQGQSSSGAAVLRINKGFHVWINSQSKRAS